jgi:hypothetical protein
MQLFAPANLPKLAPPETLYSWCGAIHRWNGNALATETSRQLFGSSRAGFYHDFPAHIDDLLRRLDGILGDANGLILKHSVLGFYLAFQTKARAKEIIGAVRAGTVPRLKFHLALPKSGIGADHPLKGCPDCFEQDEVEFSRPIWRVEHQWPTAIVCRRHARPLRAVVDSYTPVHRRDWIRPGAGQPQMWREIDRISPGAMERLTKLADMTSSVANSGESALEPTTLRQMYCAGLTDRDLIDRGGMIKLQDIEIGIREWFADLAEVADLNSLLLKPKTLATVLDAMVRGEAVSIHPGRHVILLEFLFGTWDRACSALRRSGRSAQAELFPNAAPQRAEVDPRAARFRALVDEGRSVTAAAREVGVTATTGVRWAKIAGITFTPRTKTANPAAFDKARELLRQGKSKSTVLSRVKISSVALDRLLSSEPALKQAWDAMRNAQARETYRVRFLTLRSKNPGMPIQAIRKLPGNGFHWLYRNDREWLLENLPAIWQPAPPP